MSVHSREPGELLSHWYHLFPNLGIEPGKFYDELARRIEGRGFPETRVGRVEFAERGMMSARRAYLRVLRGDLSFDICGAPFGSDSFFVSYWLGRMSLSGCLAVVAGLLVMVPGIGALFERALRPLTYYQIDTALMFQEAVHGIVLDYVDELAGIRGMSPLPEASRQPSMKRLAEL